MSEIRETRVFGPPGTGKTTYVSKQIAYAAEQYGAESIVVASFTRAAAKELISRDQVIADEQIGTLHAHCHRLLGKPQIAEANVKDFNAQFPHYTLAGTTEAAIDDGLSGSSVEDTNQSSAGEELMSRLGIYRARMTPPALWEPAVADFYKAWCDYKNSCGLVDFQDLIDIAARDFYPPAGAKIGIFDEVQDFTPSQLRLIRRWAKQMHWIMMAGDDDQTLYSFTGATPDAFLNPPIPDTQKRILRQSYRVPGKVLRLANNIVQKLTLREPKDYFPREEEGKIYASDATWNTPTQLLPVIRNFLLEDKSVMLLTTCSYMLTPTLRMLREAGMPFSNIYKSTRGDWNPIRGGSKKGGGTFGRIRAFMEPAGAEFQGTRLWTPQQMAAWVEPMKAAGNFNRGSKKGLQELGKAQHTRPEDILKIMLAAMSPEAFDKAVSLDIHWYLDQITPAQAGSFEFPAKVYQEFGPEGVDYSRKLTVGTIHSVKGAEADAVIVFPDLSMRGAQAYSMRQGEGYEQILRQFYVAVTRTRHTLVLAQGSSKGMFFNDYK